MAADAITMEKLSKTKLEAYSGLDSVKMRRRKGLFMVEGLKATEDFLRAFQPEAILLGDSAAEGKAHGRLLAAAGRAGLGQPAESLFRLATPQDMRKLSSLKTPAEVIGIFRLPEEHLRHRTDGPTGEAQATTPKDRLPMGSQTDVEGVRLNPQGLYLLLDGVRDPGNFGSIVRTADWFGVERIFASRDCADLFNPKVIQATMGSAANVAVTYCDLERLVDENPQLPLLGTLLEGEDIYGYRLGGGAMVAMGNEGQGLSEGMRRRVTVPLTIPAFGARHGESLNVGAATAAVLALLRR